MKPIVSAIALLALNFGTVADEPKADDPKKNAIEDARETFSGIWEIVATKPDGATKAAKKLVFRKDGTYAALDKDNKELWAGTYDLDPTASPKVWDHRSNESQKKGGDALGIYELDDEKLKLACIVGAWKEKQWTGKPRPTEFKLPVADVVLELRRVKAKKQ